MDEQRAWIKSRRKKRLRLLAVILCLCLLDTTYPDILETLSVFAAGTKDDAVYVTDFARLPDEVREQTVPVGTKLEKLELPDTLEAVIIETVQEEEILPEETPSPTGTATPLPSEETPTPSKEAPTPSKETDAPGQNPSGSAAEETGNTKKEENAAPTQDPASEDNAAEKTEGESAPSAQEKSVELTQETHSVAMQEYQTGNAQTVETLEAADNSQADSSSDTTAPTPAGNSATHAPQKTAAPQATADAGQEKSVVIENVTWKSKPGYDGDKQGEYIFTAILPDGYAPASGVSLPEITVTVEGESEQARELDALLKLLRALPDPEKYLTYDEAADKITTHSEIIDEKQLRKVREAADEYLEKYPDSDKNVTCGADIDKNRDDNTSFGESEETLAELLTRLEGLEHIRDTETDCMDSDCVYHHPQFIKERMDENEIPELLTMEDLVEDFGIEEPERSPARSRARLAAAPKLHPQTLMITADNENNAHTGTADNDMDRTMTLDDGNHPVEISFTLNELPTQSAYLAVKAYDVDEESGEHDFVYFNDDIYKPMDKEYISSVLFGDTKYNASNIGYLSGTNETWNVTVLKVPLEKLVKGKNVISITVANGWCVDIDWMQLVLDGGAADPAIDSFSLKLSNVVSSGNKVTLHADVTVEQSGSTKYVTEYTLTQEATGDALDACFGSAQTKESISFTMDKGLDTGTYKITGLLKDPNTEAIKAMDSVSFYFIKGEGVGPKVSHTLTPDTLTNGSVTIRVQAEAMPSVTNVTVSSPTRTVTANGRYGFTVSYQINGSQKSFTYYVTVNNIDKIPPVISYTPLTVQEDTPQTEVDALFQASLSASDDRKLADNPLTWTLPANISYLPGTKNVTVTAADAAGNTVAKTCAVTVTAKPLQLTMKEPTEVSGSKDSFALKAVLTHTGADEITKTGFVWGVMPNPTLEVKNGSAATASLVKTKGAALSATATGIASGVQYYARAYATLQNGSTIYSDSSSFGFGVPDYGTFSVSKVSGSTFTISRTGGTDGRQTVHYRTINGSAIGGTHFTHAAGSLVFADGETSKTVTVSEKGVTASYGSNTATSYSNADRTYSLEIYRVEGGGQLDSDKKNRSKTRTMTKNSGYTIDRGIYTTDESVVNVGQTSGTNGRKIADTTSKQGGKTTNVSFLTNRYGNKNYNTSTDFADYYTDAKERTYLKNTAAGWYYRYDLLAYEDEDGYEHAYIGKQSLSDKHYGISSADAAVSGQTGQLWACNFLQGEGDSAEHYYFPDSRTGGGENAGYPLKSSGSRYNYGGNNYVRLGLDETCYVYFGSTGKDKDIWYVDGLTSYARVYDEQEPKCIGVAPMAGGTYLPGDDITVALVFDEIVDKTNSTYINNVSINTNVGTLTYKGGVNTNVLYFGGQVASGSSLSGSSALKVTKINNSSNIKDMCDGGSSTPSYSGNTNVSVDASKPSVTITAQTRDSLPQHKAKITSSEATVQYAWTKDAGMPAAGWQTANSGVTLTERRGSAGTSETWYLHVLATASSGAVTHKYQAFTFMQPDITAVSVKARTSATSADVSDVWKSGKYIVAQYAGGQTSGTKISLSGPQMETQNISAQSGAAAFYVTKNGTYTVTLTDSYNNVITKTIEVKKIDGEKPTAAVQSGSQTGDEVTHNSVTAVITPADTGGSGVAKVEYAWTDSTNTPSSWTTLNKEADGSYRTTYNATETARTAKYLYVKVTDSAGNVSSIVRSGPYYVVKAATGNALPTITVTLDDSTWTKSKTLKWTAKAGTGGAAIKSVTVPTADAPVTGTSGSCEVTKNGNYRFAVTDVNGNTVSKQVTVTKIDNEAPELTKVTAEGGKTAKITLTGVTDNLTRVLDGKGNFKEMGGSGVKTQQYQLEGESAWQTFSGDSFAPNKNGTYKIRLTDNAGNVSEIYSVTLSNLDKTKPEVTCRINATANATSGWYTTYPLPVELTYADNAGTEGGASGIASVQYKWVNSNASYPTAGLSSLNAAAVAGGTYTVNLGYYDNAEAYYLYYKVTDKTGNVTEGYSDLIKKDSYKGSAGISGPTTGQPATSGLNMQLNSLVYGPSGGYVTGGTWAQSGPGAAKLASITGHTTAGQKTYSGTPNYKAKTPGSNYFRFYPVARGGGSYYWAFYVREVTFDSQGGSAVPAQLVWHDSTSNVKCTVTEPTTAPTRTGYTFGGWYTDAACTDGKEFNFDTQLRADTTLYAKWTANKYKVTLSYTYPDGKGGNSETSVSDSYFYGEGYTLPPVPGFAQPWMDKGFAFDGWYTNANCTGPKYTAVGKTATGDKEYYGRCIDVQEPTFRGACLNGSEPSAEKEGLWYRDQNSSNRARFVTIYNDNNGYENVTGYIIVDGKEATTDGVIDADGAAWWYYLLPGEHTYQWKLEDRAGNVALSDEKTYKYDNMKPVDGTITYDGVADVVKVTNTDNSIGTIYYLCGNEKVVLSVRMTDDRSGVNKRGWYVRKKGASGTGTSQNTSEQLSGKKEETVIFQFGPNTAKEMRQFECWDRAGNRSSSWAKFDTPFGSGISTGSNWMGIIVENTKPHLTIEEYSGAPLSTDWYDYNNLTDKQLKIAVYANDTGSSKWDQEDAVSSGMKRLTWTVNGKVVQTIAPDTWDINSGLTMDILTLTASNNDTGVLNITVTAEDHAGNTASQSVVVKIKGTEMTPKAEPDYPGDALYGLAPNAQYQITVPDSSGTDKNYTVTSDENGRIPFVLDKNGEEGGAGDMCGKTVQIVKLGITENGTQCTKDSDAQELIIAARLDTIEADKIKTQVELAPDAENAKIDLNIDGVTGTKEYSVGSGTTWTDVPSDNVIQNLKKGDVITVRMKATDSRPHSLKTAKNIGESTGTITAVYDLNYPGASNPLQQVTNLKGSSVLAKPENDPSREGYEFKGWYMEKECLNEWRFTSEGGAEVYKVRDWRKNKSGTGAHSTTFDPDEDGDHYKITLYAKWRETTPPELTPKLTTTGAGGTVTQVTNEDNWYPNLTLTTDYSDNVEVTKLFVKVDGGEYKELDIKDLTPGGGNPAVYHYTYALLEGRHTYQFKAEDAAGNWKESGTVTAMLDMVNPALGEADVSKGYHSFWDWIVKNEKLEITVPVKDEPAGSGIEASGIESVKYVLTPEGGTEKTAQDATVSGDKAVIQIAPDFKGTVRITAYDNAGNKDEKIIGTDGIKGVIVEDNAPEITILADRKAEDFSSTEDAGITISAAYYDSAPRLYVKVTDDKADNTLITSGLQSVTWSVNGGAEHQSGMNFETDTIKTAHSFTISALEGMDGTVRVTVKAVDQARNEKTVTKTVNIKTKEEQPVPVIDYRKEILTGLVENAKYKVLGTDGNEQEIMADGSGHIKIQEEWFGREVQICKAGTSTTLDSAKTDVKPAVRPEPPKTEAKKAETVKSQADGVIGASDDASSLDLTTLEYSYSADGGESWENWNPVTADMLTDGKLQDCAAGAWLFRVPACDTAPYGETTEVIIGAGDTLTVSFDAKGGSTVDDITDLSWHDKVNKPADPVREGYAFEGWYQEDTFKNEWHFNGENPVTVMEDNITLYAKWRDNVNPALGAVLVSPRSNGSADGGQWYNSLSIALTYSDNTAVTDLSVSVDGGAYAQLDITGADVAGKAPDGSVQYRLDDNNLTEGEHTYIFKAVDEGGNETVMEPLTARLDKTNPETGEASYEEGYANLWNWIIRKDSLLITVPVTDAGSGVESVAYKLTPVGADGNGDDSKAVDGSAKIKKVSDGEFTAAISVPADFKGTVKVTAADKAGNTAAEKTLGVSGGIIVEDNAPKVSFMTGGLAITEDFYETAPEVEVTVDDTGDGITGGIASVQYEIKDGNGKTTTYTVGNDYKTSLAGSDSFTIPASVFSPKVNKLTVTATDNAGNSASMPVTVKIKEPEPTPNPGIDYVAERLTGLVANAEYKIEDVGMKADAKGSVPIDESWIGQTVSVVRMPGTGENTVSAAKSMAIPDRPEAPAVTITNETYPDAGNGTLTMTETGKVYQFSLDGTAWTDAETGENHQITGLEAKDYYVRARAIENQSFRSKEGTVTVGTTPPTPYDTPDIAIDYENEELTGLVPGAEYIVEYVESTGNPDEDEVVTAVLKADEDGNIPVDETWLGKEPLSIVQQGNGKEKSDSEEAILGEGTLPVRPGAPSPSGEDETGIQTGGKLTDLTPGTDYDISKDGGKTWIRKKADGSGVISGVDAPATYIVRVAAVGGFKGPNSGEVTVDGYHIPVTFVANGVTAGTSWAYYGKAPEKIPAVPKKADAGDKTYVGEWCADESGTPADFENITDVTAFYACYTVGYNVNLQGGAGYGLAAGPGSATPVKGGGSFTLQFTLKSGYQKTAAFAVKVDGVKIELAEDGTYTIENILEDHTVTVEGIVAVEKPSGSSGGSGHHSKDDDDDDKTGGTNPGETTPGSTTLGGTDGTNPDGTNPGGTGGTNPGGDKPGGSNTNPGGTKPGDTKSGSTGTNPGGTNPDGNKPGGTGGTNPGGTNPGGKYPVQEVPDGKTPGGNDLPDGVKMPGGSNPDGTKPDGTDPGENKPGTRPLTVMDVPVKIEDGKLVMTLIATGNAPGMPADGTTLQAAGGGTVTVTVICEDEAYTAGVRDTVAVANAVLTPDQIELIGNGEAIEILIDVKDITDSILPQDKDVIGDGMKASREEIQGLTLGMYIDISMFIKIGASDWDAVTETTEPIDVVIGVPEELKADGRKFYIIRSHDGAYALLPDTDDEPDTITVSTNLFSAYAIAYEEADGAGAGKCGLCHICPTFLGICYFVWLAVIVVTIVVVWIVIRRKKEEEVVES